MIFYSLHLPDAVRLFTVPRAASRRWDDGALVYNVLVGHGRAPRHYSFINRNRWFEVNVSLTVDGGLLEERRADLLRTFNGDLATPPRMVGRGPVQCGPRA